MRRPVCQGFTLIELILVLTILAIVVTVGAPSFSGIMRENRVKNGVRQVATAIQATRINAITGNRRCFLDFAPGGLTPADSFYTIWLDMNGDRSYDNGEIDSTGLALPESKGGFRGFKLPHGVSFGAGGVTSGPEGMPVVADGVDFNGNDRVSFNSQGEGTAGVVYVQSESQTQYAVTVTRLGRARIWRWEDNQWK